MGRFLSFRTLMAAFVFALMTIPLSSSLVDLESAEYHPERSSSSYSNHLLEIESHAMTASEVEEKKAIIGVKDPSKDYNLLVEGHGTGLAPPTEEEWSRMIGSIRVVESVSSNALEYASSFDLSTQSTFPEVGDQGSQGSCAAWAVTYYAYGFEEASDSGWSGASSGLEDQLLSPAWTYNRVSTGKGSGSSMTENGLVLKDWGVPSMEAMTYDENDWLSWGNDIAFRQAPLHRASEVSDISYNSANPSETIDTVKNLVKAGVPVNFAIWADSSWYFFGDGNYILSSIEYRPTGRPNHAQTIVGWDDTLSDDGDAGAFKIVNSWGTGWGNEGYYWISYDTFKEIGGQLELTYIEDRSNYQPSLLAVWQFNDCPSKSAGFSVDLGTGSGKLRKDPYYYDYSGSYPNFMCLDITEFASKYAGGTHDFHLGIGSGTHNGVLSSFKVERYDSGYIPGKASHDSGQAPSGVTSTPCSASVSLNNYPFLQLSEAVDVPSLTLETGGTASWVPVDSVHYLGSYSAQSGDVADRRSSWMNLSVLGPGSVAFQWRVSSESNYDFLSYQKDGIIQESISGETAWIGKSVELEAGVHQLSWVFSKDDASSSGAGCGWIDQLSWTPPASASSIRINNNEELLSAASAYEWSGSGSSVDPMTIEKMEIDAQGKGSCLYLGNTTLFVTLRDCHLFNSSFSYATYDDGSCLILLNVQNFTLQNNQFEQSDIGVSIANSSQILVIDNNLSYNSKGMVISSSLAQVRLNHFSNNELYGLEIASGSGSIIQGNSFKGNHGAGIAYDPSHIQALDLEGNDWSAAYGNLWSDWISPDGDQDGIVDQPYQIDGGIVSDLKPLTSSLTPPHDLTGSYMSNALRLSWQAPYFSGGEEVLQYKIFKTLRSVTSVIISEGSASSYIDSQFSQGSTYNYSVMAVTASGESAHSNSVSVHVPDNTPPTITITSPAESAFFKIGSVQIAWNGRDGETGVDHYEFRLDGGSWIGVGLSTSRTLNGLAQGSHAVQVKAVDKEANFMSDQVEFTIDSLPPRIDLISPQVTSIWNSSVHLEFLVSDQNSGDSSATISGYYQASGGNLEVDTSLSLPDGVYLLTIQSIDKAGNSASVSVSFAVDTSIPEVRITSGQNGTILNGINTEVTWEAEDGYRIDHFEVSLDGASFIPISDASSLSLTDLADGSHTFDLEAVDSGGNTAFASISFMVDTAPPRIISFGPYGEKVSIDSEVTISFTSDLDLDSVLILVYHGERILGEVGRQGTTFHFSPSSSLEYGSNYTVQVWAKDEAANQLNFSWDFRTQDLGSISGLVRDSKGNAVQGAAVILDDSEVTTTAANGSFSLSASPGDHSIRIVKEGFLNLTKELVVEPGIENDLGSLSFAATSQDRFDNLLLILAAGVSLACLATLALWKLKRQ